MIETTVYKKEVGKETELREGEIGRGDSGCALDTSDANTDVSSFDHLTQKEQTVKQAGETAARHAHYALSVCHVLLSSDHGVVVSIAYRQAGFARSFSHLINDVGLLLRLKSTRDHGLTRLTQNKETIEQSLLSR
jgi:hypothetical protein